MLILLRITLSELFTRTELITPIMLISCPFFASMMLMMRIDIIGNIHIGIMLSLRNIFGIDVERNIDIERLLIILVTFFHVSYSNNLRLIKYKQPIRLK